MNYETPQFSLWLDKMVQRYCYSRILRPEIRMKLNRTCRHLWCGIQTTHQHYDTRNNLWYPPLRIYIQDIRQMSCMERAPLFTDENPCFVYRALQYCPDIRMKPQHDSPVCCHIDRYRNCTNCLQLANPEFTKHIKTIKFLQDLKVHFEIFEWEYYHTHIAQTPTQVLPFISSRDIMWEHVLYAPDWW